MDELYRMLGREREADLAREAAKFARADLVRGTSLSRRAVRARLASLKQGWIAITGRSAATDPERPGAWESVSR